MKIRKKHKGIGLDRIKRSRNKGKSIDQVYRTGKAGSRGSKSITLGMTVRIGKKESPKKVAGKIRKITSRSKKINWDKYFGKIEFPIDALTYQRKLRNEWAR